MAEAADRSVIRCSVCPKPVGKRGVLTPQPRCLRCYTRHLRGLPDQPVSEYAGDRNTSIGVKLSPSLKKKATRAAKQQGKTLSRWVENLMRFHLGME